MSNFPNLLPLLFCLAANAALAARVEFVGDYSFDIDRNAREVTVEIEELRNVSRSDNTGRLFLSLRYTQCAAPTSYGFPSFQTDEIERQDVYPLDRVVNGGDSRLAAQGSWTDIQFTTGYQAPPSGTYRAHMVVYEEHRSAQEEEALQLVGAATASNRFVQSGRDELDSCFSALPLDVNNGHRRADISLIDGGDYFRLQSHARGNLGVEVAGSFDFVADLLDSEGRTLNTGSNGGESASVRIERQIDDRAYYLRIMPRSGDYGSYTVRTAFTPGKRRIHERPRRRHPPPGHPARPWR